MGAQGKKAWIEMNNILLDTDILVDYFRKYEKAQRFFEELRKIDCVVYFSAITETELLAGKECNAIEIRARLLDFLSNFTKISVNNPIAMKAGDFRRVHGIKTADAIIAATAFFMKANLITRNAADYKGVKEINVKVPY